MSFNKPRNSIYSTKKPIKGLRSYPYKTMDFLFNCCQDIHLHQVKVPKQPNASSKANCISHCCTIKREMFNDFINFCPTEPHFSNHHQEWRMPFHQTHNCFPELGFHCPLPFHIRIFMILKGVDAESKWVSEEQSLVSLHLHASISSIFNSSFPRNRVVECLIIPIVS